MAAWEWITWGITALIAIGGFILGVRAELRASYRKNWTVTPGRNNRFINRTGEEATDIRVETTNGWIGSGSPVQDHIDADAEFALTICTTTGGKVKYHISWIRPSNGKTYKTNGELSRSWSQSEPSAP